MTENFGTGALQDPQDPRDVSFSAVAPFDWELGFDIELLLGYRLTCKDEAEFWGPRGRRGWGVERYREIVELVKKNQIPSFKIEPKNQGSSSSCTGQALSQYISVLNMIETGDWVEVSARDIYAYISLGMDRGAYLRDALKLAVDRGISTEELVPSYTYIHTDTQEIRNPLTEAEFLVKPEESEAIQAIRVALQAKEYQVVNSSRGDLLEQMAWTTLLGFGCYFGVVGQNNGTWHTTYPQLPTGSQWQHALYAGKAVLRDGKKMISHINSWGNGVGEQGWQYLGDNYIGQGIGPTNVDAVFNPWTLLDKPNKPNDELMSNVKVIKDKNSAAVGFWIPALTEGALDSLAANFGKVLPKQADGKIDWEKAIEGELSLKK